MDKYFLYIRKSTDEDDRQILSLEAQETELLELAAKEHLAVVDIFRESQTAKQPGRPIFNQMLDRMEKGEADGILSWHPDRLARNSVDGGKIIFLVDSEQIKHLKFPTFWFEATPQGKFMLNIAFGQSKYFVDNLSENTKRGLRQKLRRGEMPGAAPLGYLNDRYGHTIVKDPKRFSLVKELFVRYASGGYSLKDLRKSAISAGLFSKKDFPLSVSVIRTMLQNPFYYGAFLYNGELWQGKHEPMIAKKLFDQCQQTLGDRARPQLRKVQAFAFRGLMACAECGCAITSEMQKGHNYYRCTKKHGHCSQAYIREEALTKQIDCWLKKVSLPAECADALLAELEADKERQAKDKAAFAQNLTAEIAKLENRMEILLDAHLDGLIGKIEYVSKKQKILNRKIELSQKLRDFEQNGNHWLEPAKNFISSAKQAENIALQSNLFDKKDWIKKIGSNLVLRDKKLTCGVRQPWNILVESGFAVPKTSTEPRRGEVNSLQRSKLLRD